MSKIFAFGLTAAAVVVALVVGSQLLGSPTPGGVGAGPTATPQPSSAPPSSALPAPSAGGNPAGSFVLYDGQGDRPSVTVTLPAPGWDGDPGGDAGLGNQVAKDPDVTGQVDVAFWVVTHVYADACQSEGTLREIGPAPDDLVTALLAQEDIAVEGPTALTIDGYPAQRLDLAYPPELDASACSHGPDLLQVWADEAETFYFILGHDQQQSVYVVDVDGERVVLSTGRGDGASAEDIAEMEAVLASVQIGE